MGIQFTKWKILTLSNWENNLQSPILEFTIKEDSQFFALYTTQIYSYIYIDKDIFLYRALDTKSP